VSLHIGVKCVVYPPFRLADLSAITFGEAEAAIVCLEQKNQSKRVNYAKRTQIFKKSNVYNLNNNKELQQKMANGHLVKTNPNEPNFKRHTCSSQAGQVSRLC
jgi:hypothetical protein